MTFHIETIDHIQLAAPKGSEEEARKFFRDILRFKEIEKPAELRKRGGVWFECGKIQLHIGIEEPFSPAKKAHPAFEVKNITELMEHLVSCQVVITEDDKLPGAKRFYTFDPFGNRLEFLEWIESR
ncbi:VOC family protein [Bacillus sp. Hm123]|uniref:VOC family protein n=1 Tax=Bacillus sp. Hm123 TaxID=3450745 RepID=UPI003F422253